MTPNKILPVSFYERDVLDVARHLLGKLLVRQVNGVRISGIISETEAYRGEEDLACHARAGKTARTAVMYGPPGRAYVYFTYGMHWLLNCVTGQEGFPAAVLLRAIQPMEGIETISNNRHGRHKAEWTNGPAKICQAMVINGQMNGIALFIKENGLWIEENRSIPDKNISSSPRIGINRVPEPWRSIPWRFVAELQSGENHV